MSKMIEILQKIDGLFITPISDGADEQNNILCNELPFKIVKFKSGSEHNGWVVPDKWEVLKAEIKKDGQLIYDGKKHPLGVIGSSASFVGQLPLDDLKKHIFYQKNSPNNIVYHCDLYYKPYRKLWGFSMPYNTLSNLRDGNYNVELLTKHSKGTMKILELTHKGKTDQVIILNAHNCHAAQLNDGPSGFVVGTEVMKKLMKKKTKFTYKLIIAPEHIGTVFYLANLSPDTIKNFKYCIFLEMLGHNNPNFALQESFFGQSKLDRAAHHFLKFNNPSYLSDKFRKIVGNDETVWEAAGIEIPTISLSRCNSSDFYYPEYHLDTDNINIMDESKLNESVNTVLGIIDILEKDCTIQRKFNGLIALSNPKYDLYINTNDPSIDDSVSEKQLNWNHLMDCLPRYFDGKMSILNIAIKHNIPFNELFNYLLKFEQKGLINFESSNQNIILGERIYLRELIVDDASEDYCNWLNDPIVNKYLETRKATLDDVKIFIQKQVNNPNSFFVGIFDKNNNKHIGNIKLEPIDWKNKKAIFGILIGDKNYWGKGIGPEATKLILNHAFNIMNLNKIELGVISENKPAIKVYEKVGFKIVNIKKNAVNHDGTLFDDITMVIKK